MNLAKWLKYLLLRRRNAVDTFVICESIICKYLPGSVQIHVEHSVHY